MKRKTRFDRLIDKMIKERTPKELAIGFVRYRAVQALNIEIEGKPMDDEIDRVIEKWNRCAQK